MTETVYVGTSDSCEYIWAGVYSAGAVSAFVVQPDSHLDQPEVRVHASHGSIARAWMERNGFRKPRVIQSAGSTGSLFG